MSIGNSNIQLSYITLTVLIIALLFAVGGGKNKRKTQLLSVFILFQTIVYVLGTVIAYMFKFSEFEGSGLASFTRYMTVPLYAAITALVCLLFTEIAKSQNEWLPIIALCITLFVCPYNKYFEFIRGETSRFVTGVMQQYSNMESIICNNVKADDKVYIISQGDSGYDYLVLKYKIRPIMSDGWAVCTENPGTFEKQMSSEEFLEFLVSNYDYLAIYKANEMFVNDYSYLFEDEIITDETIYRIDKITKMLVPVQ